MAGAEDGEATEAFSVATWRIVTLFFLILLVDTAVELVDEFVNHHLKRNPESAHAWSQLKFETMALGVVSLLLVVFEEHLLKICIDSPKKDEYGDDATYAEDAYAPDKALDADDHHRRLLASSAGNPCSEGKESLWSADLIHKAHILIFLIAACHLIWAILSSVMSMVALRRWNTYEAHIHGRGLLHMPVGGLQRHGEPAFVYGLRQCIRQFSHPVDEAQFGAIRELFIEFTKSEESFDFAAFVSNLLTAEFASVVKIDIFMWGLVCIWVSFPEGSYGGLWLTGAFVVVSLIAGAKLHVVAMHLSRHAYSRFYRPVSSHKPSKQEIASISENTKDALKSDSKAAEGPVAEAVEQDVEPVKVDDSEVTVGEAPSKRVALRRMVRGHSQRIKGADHNEDLLSLFWFRKPRHMLRVFRYAFFQSALGVAAIIFRFWQDEDNFLGGAISNYGTAVRVVGWLFFLLVVLLLWHISVYLLPVYALTTATVMFSKVANVLAYAKRNNIRPELVDFLERTAARKGDDEDSDDEDIVHVVANCNNQTCAATEPTDDQQQHSGAATKSSAAQLSERAGSLLAKEGSAPDGVSAPVSSSSPSESAAVAVGTVNGKPSSENEQGMRPGLGMRAAAEMPTSGGDGGGEVDWFDQMEREQGELLGPAVVPNYTDEPVEKEKPTVQDTPQATEAPAKPAASTPEAAGESPPVEVALREKSPATAGALAASEMPVSGLQGDAAVDWLDRLEREQGDMNSSGLPPVQRRASQHSPAVFKDVTRGSGVQSTGHHLGSNREKSGMKSFASVMLAPRVTADMESSACQVPNIHSSTHSTGLDDKGCKLSKHAHDDHPEPRPPTIADVVSRLLESMAAKRHAELTRRLQIHRGL